jgi:hypothetical protein
MAWKGAIAAILTATICQAAYGEVPIISKGAKVEAQPQLSLHLEGVGKIPLLVDTGSNVPLVLLSGTVPGESGSRKAVQLTSGSATIADSAMILSAKVHGAKGILGWPVLKHSIWKLDLPAGCHEFLAALPEETATWTTFPIAAKRESLAIVHPVLGEVFIDSGARRGVCLSAEKWAAWRKANPGMSFTLAEGFSPASPTGAFASETAYGAAFDLSPLKLTQTNVGEAFFDSSHDGARILLGLEALSEHTVIVDGPGKRVYFQPASIRSRYQPISPNLVQTAFLPDPAYSTALYVKTLSGGLGEKAGLRTGDLVLECNGSGSPPSFETMHALVRKPGSKLNLKILRNRQRLELSLVVP